MEAPLKKSKPAAPSGKTTSRTKTKTLRNPTSALKSFASKNPRKAAVIACAVLALLVDVVVGSVLWQRWVVDEEAAQLGKLSQQNARKLSVNVGNYLDAVQKKLTFFTQNQDLISALTNHDEMVLRDFKRGVQNQLPKLDAVRLIPVGTAELDQEAAFPLRFLELELIKRAEKREDLKLEAVKLTQGWRLNLILPIPSNKELPVVGTLMVTLPMDDLLDGLGEGVAGSGQISLLQLYDKTKTHVLYSSGNGSLPPPVRRDVLGTTWLVEYLPNQTLMEQAQAGQGLLLLEGAISVLASLALALMAGIEIGRRREARLEQLALAYRPSVAVDTGRDHTAEILDITLDLGDEALLGLSDAPLETGAHHASTQHEEADAEEDVPAHIFRAYDIRGLANTEISKELAYKIGQALGSEALDHDETSLIVAKDARTHSPLLAEYLIRGIISTGCRVINIGTVPTPLLYFATETLGTTRSGVMVTASHNDAEYNGFKVVMQGQARMEEDIMAIRSRILSRNLHSGIGQEEHFDILPAYIEAIFNDVALAGDISIVIDAGNGVTGKVAPRLFEELGCRVTPLYCDLDGTFPNHGPDPSLEANLKDLIRKVKEEKADLGVAFDGDGDRLTVVSSIGQIIWPDRLLMLFAKDILSRNPGADVVFDVKCSRRLNAVVSSQGGRPIMWKTGHSPMKAKMQETGALVGGEYSGHIFIKDRWYGFDDGLYAAARLIEIMSLRDQSLDAIFAEFPPLPSTPDIRVPVAEDQKFAIVQRLIEEGDFGDAKINTLDGLRADFAYGWGIVRASNTSACLTLRFEADTDADLHQLKALFTREIRKLDTCIVFNW